MNPLHKFMDDVKAGGVSVELKRQTDHGILAPVKDQEMKALGTKARIASTAQLLEKLTKEEKLEWAIETKNEGNKLFSEGKYTEAMEKYVETLAASDFGSKNNVEELKEEDNEAPVTSCGQGNVDELVVPVLCNLAACSMRLHQWPQAISFCDQALALRPDCAKAMYRKGKSLLQTTDYKKAKELFLEAKEVMDKYGNELLEVYLLSPQDYQTIPSLLAQAQEGIKRDRQAAEQMKLSLQKAFSPPVNNNNPAPAVPAEKQEVLPMSFTELMVFVLEVAFKYIVGLFGVQFQNKKKTPIINRTEREGREAKVKTS